MFREALKRLHTEERGSVAATLERPAQGRGAGGKAPARPLIPFVRAAHQHTEGPFFQVTVTPGLLAQAIGPFDVPAYGFLKNVVIVVTSAGGALGTGVLSADYPNNVFSSVALTDPNNNNIQYPVDGFQLAMENLFGGYVFSSDPAAAPDYSATINPAFMLRIPVEITPWDAFGALANQNPASAFKVALTIPPLATLLSTVGTATAPNITIRGYLEAWSAPAPTDLLGQAQETLPPGLGTTQYWSPFSPVVAAGQQTIRLTKVGNLIRNLVLITRDVNGARSAAMLPDPIRIVWDAADLINEPVTYRRKKMFEQSGIQPPVGVYCYSFTDDQDGHNGYENRHLWLPTVQSTRLEIQGVFGAAGTIQILTNDVAVTPAGR